MDSHKCRIFGLQLWFSSSLAWSLKGQIGCLCLLSYFLLGQLYSKLVLPCSHIQALMPNSGFLNLTIVTLGLKNSFLRGGGLSWAWQDVKQHPWPLPIRHQQQPSFPPWAVTTKSVSRHCQCLVGEGGSHHWLRASILIIWACSACLGLAPWGSAEVGKCQSAQLNRDLSLELWQLLVCAYKG